MIIVVEGVSAAGKTTYCRRFYPERIPEAERLPEALADADHKRLAEHWQQSNAIRWRAALDCESTRGLAVCDTDPFKLHYSWCLWRIGRIADSDWRYELNLARESFTREELGLADLVVIANPGSETLRRFRAGDETRQRRRFELHRQLQRPLFEWYAAFDRLEPGRVRRGLPNRPLTKEEISPGRRAVRTGRDVFDSLVVELMSHAE